MADMTPLSPEAVAQMVADREAGTPGPWQFQIETDQDGYDEGVYVTVDIVTVHWSNLGFGADEYDTRVDDAIKANAHRIARLPDLEAAYLTLAAENATLRAERAMLKFDNATMLTQIEGHNAAWDALRASEAAALERVTRLELALLDAGAMRDAADRVSEWFCTDARQFEGPRIQGLRMAIVAYDRHMQPNPSLNPTADKEPKT